MIISNCLSIHNSIINMPKKQKSHTCTAGWCQNHLFVIKRVCKGSFFKKIQKMRLCPTFDSNLNNFSKSIPVINKDNKFYTPTFILESQKKFYEQNTSRFLIKHMEKVQQNESGKSEIVIFFKFPSGNFYFLYLFTQLVPRQSANINYCAVCHQQYEDYLKHIVSHSHRETVNSSKYTSYIKEFQEKYKKNIENQRLEKVIQSTEQIDQTNQILLPFDGILSLSQNFQKNQFQSQFFGNNFNC